MTNKLRAAEDNRIITGLIAVIFASFFIFDMTNASSLSIIVELGILLILYCFRFKGRITVRIAPFHIRILVFGLFCILSALWAWMPSSAFQSGITVLEILACMSVVFLFYQDSEHVNGLLDAIMWSGIIVILYMVMEYGIEALVGMAERAERMDADIANPNMVAIWISFCAVAIFHKLINSKFRLSYLSLAGMVLFLGLLQSRTALFVTLIGMLLALYFRATEKGSGVAKTFRFIMIAAVFLFAIYQVSQLAVFNGIIDRIRAMFGMVSEHKESSSALRRLFMQIGIEQFIKTPILGIGIGSTPNLTSMHSSHYTYLHNNYVEMLASGGIIGFLIYYSIYYFAF